MITTAMFSEFNPILNDYELLAFASPEIRCMYGPRFLQSVGNLKRSWLFEFADYDDPYPLDVSDADRSAAKQYRSNRDELHTIFREQGAEVERSITYLDVLESYQSYFGSSNHFRHALVVDISCAPRARLLALLSYLSECQRRWNQKVILVYSTVRRHSIDEEAFSYGIQDIAVVPGFHGRVRLRQDLLVAVLGFEGNRAFAVYRRLMPHKAYLILGDSQDESRTFYMEQALKNNQGLLRIHGNKTCVMASRNPLTFAESLNTFLQNEIHPLSDRFNVYFSCLGTKPQTIGSFLTLRQYPYIQLLESVPSRRRIATEGAEKVLFANLGESGLVRSIPELVAGSR
jgi:hypothetical protein